MRYSLFSRFRGTLLGALLGANLAKSGEEEPQGFSDIGKLMLLGTESLISLGKLDLDDWKQRQQQALTDLNISNSVSLKVILATLPVALFFHDNLLKLRHNLLCTYQIWGDDPVVRDGILAVGYTVAQCLTEKLNSQTLIPQIIAFVGDTPTSLPKKLLQVNDLLAKHAGLETAEAELSTEDKISSAIAIAFYYFLSTLEDFRLTVLRSTHHPTRLLPSQTISAIAGALSGAYNSTAGIPVQWRLLYSSTDASTRILVDFPQMLELTDALLVVWSGAYDLSLHSKHFPQEGCIMLDKQNAVSVFAAPRVIRSR
ncbi:ADP-ribosylglycohydrolase family protein [Fortiea sp. LEGE XX443]|uniref:ADP-ribosylglycohydrolase family protein n=1 Tax=Fortiea sp. LEGE XX443 TaxID=1828611 RepID=UPI0018829925|nr:ADP-ribosylglycohydrolase family protein [Fortiea sp. LEGE XX443]MBE9006761.1 ADP-ribosylglycohydrolase family protein [Fortiea sp. LEGE XX443]